MGMLNTDLGLQLLSSDGGMNSSFHELSKQRNKVKELQLNLVRRLKKQAKHFIPAATPRQAARLPEAFMAL